MKVRYQIDGLIHNLSHAEFPARLNEIQDSLRQYGHILAAWTEDDPAVFVVEYDADPWDVREWAVEMQADLDSFGRTTYERVVE